MSPFKAIPRSFARFDRLGHGLARAVLARTFFRNHAQQGEAREEECVLCDGVPKSIPKIPKINSQNVVVLPLVCISGGSPFGFHSNHKLGHCQFQPRQLHFWTFGVRPKRQMSDLSEGSADRRGIQPCVLSCEYRRFRFGEKNTSGRPKNRFPRLNKRCFDTVIVPFYWKTERFTLKEKQHKRRGTLRLR